MIQCDLPFKLLDRRARRNGSLSGTMAWKWIDNLAGNGILCRLRLYDPTSARAHASATAGQSSPCSGFRAQANRFAQLAVRALLVALGAGSACGGSGPATTATNPAAGDLQLAGDVTGLSSNNQVNGTHLSSPLPVSQGGTGTSSAAANTVFAGPTSGSAAAPGFRSLTLSDLPNISPGYILGNATASAMAPSAVMGTCTPALMSTTNTAAQNVTAYTTAASIALNTTFGNVCLPPGILPFATVRLTQTFSGVHTIGALPTQTFSANQPSLGYSLTGGTPALAVPVRCRRSAMPHSGPHWLGCPTGSRISAPGLVRLILRAARHSRVYPASRR
jgi:hypothetical protein